MLSRILSLGCWRAINLTLVLTLVLIGIGVVLLVVRVSPVTVVWETASEVGTAGFNVYRAENSASVTNDPWTKINDDLIPAQGDEVVGARYRYEDHDVQPGRRYQYQIEEVEWDGASTLYPNTVQVRAGLPSVWTRVEGIVLILFALLLLWRTGRKTRSC